MSVVIVADYTGTGPTEPTKIEVSIDDDTVHAMHTHTAVTAAPGIDDLICNTLAHLGAPGVTRTTTGPAVPTLRVIDYPNRVVAVQIGGTEIARTDYDAVGWNGLTAVADVASAIAKAYDLPYEHLDGADEGDDTDGEG